MNLEHRSGSPSFSNPAKTRAEFTYSMVLNRIKIIDLNRGTASVTNDIENVLRKIEAWHQGSVADYHIMYKDADAYWDGCEWDGEHARFFAIRETDQAAAEKKLSAHQVAIEAFGLKAALSKPVKTKAASAADNWVVGD
jgi:hypothetical protein